MKVLLNDHIIYVSHLHVAVHHGVNCRHDIDHFTPVYCTAVVKIISKKKQEKIYQNEYNSYTLNAQLTFCSGVFSATRSFAMMNSLKLS